MLIAHDQPLARSALENVLKAEPDIEVVAVCEEREADAEVQRCRPDVLLLSTDQDDTGSHTAAWLRTLPEPPITALLVDYRYGNNIATTVRSGVTGLLDKNSEPRHFVDAVRVLASRGTVLAEPFTKAVLNTLLKSAPTADRQSIASALSSRERSILALVAQGLSNKGIADQLFLSPGTVKSYLSEIMAKTGSSNRVQVAVLACKAGLIDTA
ncbi:response regulator transcription factor (plasmid) [Streptomyces sp. HU2014]|uniref:response regulator transcription factor n=1 Tax=Streptomyces sp. HU2014 TaxID=2939414 RepID=UPI00200E9700|nr:response regulator transcription factor [Streptomyces sp. HU2014]UQI49733.1 response regulator transcription factor [Streptomyces sp. HU2014]